MKNTVLDEFDYIYVTVKNGMSERVTAGYEALGWECVKTEFHSRYFDERNLTFRRPHLIDHKDERQLLQVYLESALNGLGKLITKPYPQTAAYLIAVGAILLSFAVFGIIAILLLGGAWFAWGIAVTVLSFLLFVPYVIAAKKIYDSEKRKRREREKEYISTIKNICKSGIRLLGDGDE